MKKTFDAIARSVPVSAFKFRGGQGAEAIRLNCERVFDAQYCAGNVKCLPKYMHAGAAAAGFKMVYLGGTTYQYSCIGLTRLE